MSHTHTETRLQNFGWPRFANENLSKTEFDLRFQIFVWYLSILESSCLQLRTQVFAGLSVAQHHGLQLLSPRCGQKRGPVHHTGAKSWSQQKWEKKMKQKLTSVIATNSSKEIKLEYRKLSPVYLMNRLTYNMIIWYRDKGTQLLHCVFEPFKSFVVWSS